MCKVTVGRTMKIVQTFWSGGRDPLACGYGWLHAEYNLMSWTLSCLLLRRYYDRVELYTDRRGYEVLIEKLHLPYTQVYVVYDDNLCLPQHWAYAKVKTYSMQTEPFLHVDGDVYLSRCFSEKVSQANLVVQNKEICTQYYLDMTKRILDEPGIIIPKALKDKLEHGDIMSYNMGIFGGNDINFIQEYCNEVFCFVERNKLLSPVNTQVQVNCNIFFEQILFAMLSDYKKKEVTCVLDIPVKDNGYMAKDFCDIEGMDKKEFLHIIGGHKRSTRICQMLTNAAIHQDAERYTNILSIFTYRNKRFNSAHTPRITLTTESFIARYEDLINLRKQEWEKIPNEEILYWQEKGVNGLYLFNSTKERDDVILSLHPCCSVHEMASTWPEEALILIRERLKKNKYFYLKGVILSPCLEQKGVQETPLSCMGYRIISMIKKHEVDFNNILQECTKGFPARNKEELLDTVDFFIGEITDLMRYGVIFVRVK